MKNKREIIEKIKENREKIKDKSVKKIGIFGSVIKGKKNPRDIDIIIEFDKPTFDNYAEVLILLEKILKKKIDLVTKSSLRPELKYVINEAEYVKL
ncbi:MAG: nucleotidyltransferase domain-containing protein [Nanoarchaeota archaeon]